MATSTESTLMTLTYKYTESSHGKVQIIGPCVQYLPVLAEATFPQWDTRDPKKLDKQVQTCLEKYCKDKPRITTSRKKTNGNTIVHHRLVGTLAVNDKTVTVRDKKSVLFTAWKRGQGPHESRISLTPYGGSKNTEHLRNNVLPNVNRIRDPQALDKLVNGIEAHLTPNESKVVGDGVRTDVWPVGGDGFLFSVKQE